MKKLTYTSLVRSGLEYAAIIWDPYLTTQRKSIEQIQHRAIRWIMDTWHQSSSDMQHYTAEEGVRFPNCGGDEATATPDVLLQGHKWRGSGDN